MKLLKNISKAVVLVAVIVFAIWAKQSGFFESGLQAIHNLGAWSVPVFVVVYVLSCLLFFPSVVMTCGAGVLFPVPLGILLSLLGTALGSTAALLIGRYGLRSLIEKKAASNPQFQKLDSAILREGWKIILLVRLAPVFPFSIGNYLFGATSVSPWIYMATAFVGTIPSASVFVLIGHMTGSASGNHERQPIEWVLLGVGILATICLGIYLKSFFSRIFNASKEE